MIITNNTLFFPTSGQIRLATVEDEGSERGMIFHLQRLLDEGVVEFNSGGWAENEPANQLEICEDKSVSYTWWQDEFCDEDYDTGCMEVVSPAQFRKDTWPSLEAFARETLDALYFPEEEECRAGEILVAELARIADLGHLTDLQAKWGARLANPIAILSVFDDLGAERLLQELQIQGSATETREKFPADALRAAYVVVRLIRDHSILTQSREEMWEKREATRRDRAKVEQQVALEALAGISSAPHDLSAIEWLRVIEGSSWGMPEIAIFRLFQMAEEASHLWQEGKVLDRSGSERTTEVVRFVRALTREANRLQASGEYYPAQVETQYRAALEKGTPFGQGYECLRGRISREAIKAKTRELVSEGVILPHLAEYAEVHFDAHGQYPALAIALGKRLS